MRYWSEAKLEEKLEEKPMNKTEYLKRLSDELGHMPYGDVKDIIQSIEEHFDEGLGEGRSEEEIAASLGDPKELAAEFKDGVKFNQIMKKRKRLKDYTGPDGRGRIFVVIFNLFVGIAMWVILLCAIIAAFCVLAADCGLAGLIIASLIMGKIIFLALTLVCVAVFLVVLLILGIKYYAKGLKSYIRWNKNVWNYGLGED